MPVESSCACDQTRPLVTHAYVGESSDDEADPAGDRAPAGVAAANAAVVDGPVDEAEPMEADEPEEVADPDGWETVGKKKKGKKGGKK